MLAEALESSSERPTEDNKTFADIMVCMVLESACGYSDHPDFDTKWSEELDKARGLTVD